MTFNLLPRNVTSVPCMFNDASSPDCKDSRFGKPVIYEGNEYCNSTDVLPVNASDVLTCTFSDKR